MKRIINGKRYDTETAEIVADVGSHGTSFSDFAHHDTQLYRTKRGNWFVAGEGGPLSQWSRSVGNGYSGGSGIHVLSADEARALLEQHHETEALEQYFGSVVEDA